MSDQADNWLFWKLADVYEAGDPGSAGVTAVPGQLLTVRQVCTLVDISKSALYERIEAGEFPRPKRLGSSSTRWLESDIQRWQQDLAAVRSGDAETDS